MMNAGPPHTSPLPLEHLLNPPAPRRALTTARAGLQSACCKALCHLSYVWPEEVLPLVVDRFQSALSTDVATHQLPAAINTLAMCVRPMLLSGWGTPEEPAPQVRSGERRCFARGRARRRPASALAPCAAGAGAPICG